jgi:hypothetical protein
MARSATGLCSIGGRPTSCITEFFRVEGMLPERFIDAPLNLFQCVYELRIIAFESEAWRKNVVENPSPDIHANLKAQLNIDV